MVWWKIHIYRGDIHDNTENVGESVIDFPFVCAIQIDVSPSLVDLLLEESIANIEAIITDSLFLIIEMQVYYYRLSFSR